MPEAPRPANAGYKHELAAIGARADLPLNVHPATTGGSAVDELYGAA